MWEVGKGSGTEAAGINESTFPARAAALTQIQVCNWIASRMAALVFKLTRTNGC